MYKAIMLQICDMADPHEAARSDAEVKVGYVYARMNLQEWKETPEAVRRVRARNNLNY